MFGSSATGQARAYAPSACKQAHYFPAPGLKDPSRGRRSYVTPLRDFVPYVAAMLRIVPPTSGRWYFRHPVSRKRGHVPKRRQVGAIARCEPLRPWHANYPFGVTMAGMSACRHDVCAGVARASPVLTSGRSDHHIVSVPRVQWRADRSFLVKDLSSSYAG